MIKFKTSFESLDYDFNNRRLVFDTIPDISHFTIDIDDDTDLITEATSPYWWGSQVVLRQFYGDV